MVLITVSKGSLEISSPPISLPLISAGYNPGEDPTVVAALHELIAAMRTEGYAISDQCSGFRSYETQVDLYQSYVNKTE